MPDTLVGDALLAQIFDPDVNDGLGLVIDGFPRTALQVRRKEAQTLRTYATANHAHERLDASSGFHGLASPEFTVPEHVWSGQLELCLDDSCDVPLFFASLHTESHSSPVLTDGRACAQVDFLKLLYDRMLALHLKHADTADEWRFPRPSFKVRNPCKASTTAGHMSARTLCHVLPCLPGQSSGSHEAYNRSAMSSVPCRRSWCCTWSRRRACGARCTAPWRHPYTTSATLPMAPSLLMHRLKLAPFPQQRVTKPRIQRIRDFAHSRTPLIESLHMHSPRLF